tara:strand:- start:183 stop:1892 length:1710 start_codon:yes stop_codon:yes gene_type:complete
MVLLPDYPSRVVNEHRVRVEKIALIGLLTIIMGGAWWIWPAVNGDVDLLSRSSHVFLLFGSAILLSDLIDFGPVEKSRIGSVSNVVWPSLIVVAGSEFSSSDEKISSILMIILAVCLWRVSQSIFNHSLATRRLRGITSAVGLALAIATMVALSSNTEIWALVVFSVSYTLLPDLLSKDEMHDMRKQFSSRLENAEELMITLRSNNSGLEQANSLLTNAREIGWRNPQKGLLIIEEAQREASRIIAISQDLGDIQDDALSSVVSAESISEMAKSPRKAYEMGLREAQLGSLREAEILFRTAKRKASVVIDHWQEAVDAIMEAERLLSDLQGHSSDNIRSILDSAKESLDAEDPVSAKKMAANIPIHIESLTGSRSDSSKALEEAEKAIRSLERDVLPKHMEMISDSRKAFEEGNFPLSKGISESIIRDVRDISESSNEVIRALRQRKKIEARFPNSGDWMDRLDYISHLSESSEWSKASSKLQSLTSDLLSFEAEVSDARELIDFVNSEWSSLSKKLDSKGIGIDDSDRASSLRAISIAEKRLKEGDVQSCLKSLGEADSAMEILRRRL